MRDKLLYRTAFNGGLVFAHPDRAAYIHGIHSAIENSTHWADFRTAVPEVEYSRIMRYFDERGERRPADNDLFDSERLPGYSDGDYPPWLQKEMASVIPEEILSKFGILKQTFVNGHFWFIPASAMEAICEALAEAGFQLEHTERMKFW
jgi:hypothetical protein